MIRKQFHTFFIAFLLTLSLCKTNAQVRVFDKNSIETIKAGHTHIIVGDLNFPHSQEFLEVVKKYWTITKGVDFITCDRLSKQVIGGYSYDHLSENLVAGDSYFNLESELASEGGSGTSIFFYLNLWTPKEKALNKNKDIGPSDEKSIANITISVDDELMKGALKRKAMEADFDGGGHIAYWSPGTLKNFLQELSTVLQTGKRTDLSDDITNSDQLKHLKDETLFCTEDIAYKPGDKGDKSAEITGLFEDYKFNYKVITNDELSNKILTDKMPFYYLLYLHNTPSGKLVAVMNSQTGELIYLRTKASLAFHLKSGDLKDLYKEIK